MGTLLGTGQWIVLRRRFARAWTWMPASAVGWGLGMVPAFWVATAPGAAPDALQLLGLGAAGGLLMGLAVGVVTGWRLAHLARGRLERMPASSPPRGAGRFLTGA